MLKQILQGQGERLHPVDTADFISPRPPTPTEGAFIFRWEYVCVYVSGRTFQMLVPDIVTPGWVCGASVGFWLPTDTGPVCLIRLQGLGAARWLCQLVASPSRVGCPLWWKQEKKKIQLQLLWSLKYVQNGARVYPAQVRDWLRQMQPLNSAGTLFATRREEY